ncbi:RRQRL motif-containing zinc-binding protein [Streptomyces sp. SID14446]|uniref:RRQRL motif-containing zinc-binding protein n=1 Tax=Streptomyces sp. SID14446 TaxID=2706072 RepID=UPI0031B9E46F
MGLRPAGQTPIVLRCRKCRNYPERVCTRPTFLYRIDRALPVRPMTLAQERALDRAMEARQRCPLCLRRYHHVIPLRTIGSCLECHDGTPADPRSYVHDSHHPHSAAEPEGHHPCLTSAPTPGESDTATRGLGPALERDSARTVSPGPAVRYPLNARICSWP